MRSTTPGLVVRVSLVTLTLSVGICAVSAAQAQTLRWNDIRGVSSPVGLDVANNVVLNAIGTGTGVTDPGQRPWSTTGGRAKVNLQTGHLDFVVRGLVVGGGVQIGTTSPFTDVVGRLVCDTNGSASGNSAVVDTPLVALSAQGDATFSGNVGPLPVECSEPDIAFLLVNPATGRWIGYGAVRTP